MIDPRINLLLLSNSRKPQEAFLAWASEYILRHFQSCDHIIFLPFASVTYPWDDYAARVRETFAQWNLNITSIHTVNDYRDAIHNADGIVVGGGNTFNLLYHIQNNKLISDLREQIDEGIPYLGWSAGSNLICPTIQTTNDMPVRDLQSLEALDRVPFQVNVHFTHQTLAGHGGESRSDRLLEFSTLHPDIPVIGLPEGSALKSKKGQMYLLGDHTAELFIQGQHKASLNPGVLTI